MRLRTVVEQIPSPTFQVIPPVRCCLPVRLNDMIASGTQLYCELLHDKARLTPRGHTGAWVEAPRILNLHGGEWFSFTSWPIAARAVPWLRRFDAGLSS